MTRSNWAGNYDYRAPTLHEPTSVPELQDIVAASDKITALGTRHSFNDIADSASAQVSLGSLPRLFEIDEAARTVTVAAGSRYGEFVEQLHNAGWAIHNLASLPHISVAGAIATGTHGSGNKNGSLATAVARLDIVTADGGFRQVSRGDDDFDGMVVSLGALGIVAAVTLDIEPAFEVRQDAFENLSWDSLFENYDAITASAYSTSFFTNWAEFGAVSVWLKSRVDGDTTAANRDSLFGATKAQQALHPLPGGPSINCTDQLGVPGPWWNRLPHFKLEFTPSNGNEMQSEYMIPRAHALEAIAAVRALGPRIGPYLMICELRTMAADTLWMSPTYGQDSLGIHFTWKHDPAVFELLPAIDAALAPYAARPHWGKIFSAPSERLETVYPKLADFRALADRLDPAGKFRNNYLERTLFTGRLAHNV